MIFVCKYQTLLFSFQIAVNDIQIKNDTFLNIYKIKIVYIIEHIILKAYRYTYIFSNLNYCEDEKRIRVNNITIESLYSSKKVANLVYHN